MTAETPARELSAEGAALLDAVASHPDPWFSALAASYRTVLLPAAVEEGVDLELQGRLEGQVASGDYAPLDVVTEDLEAPGPHGPVPVRVYHPVTGGGPRPLLVWCHGGGFLGGDLEMPEADATSREVATRAGAVVVSVDYRLAVQGLHFPVPHDDVVAAYDWAVAHADGWGIGERRVLGGASAGANLAAGVALRLRDEGRPPAGVVLLYPLVHPELPTPSDELAGKLARLSSRHAFRDAGFRPMIENYLGAPAEQATPYAMAGLGDLACYPPTLVINDEYDGLRASGEAFTAALSTAGVPVTQLLAPDVLHGHINSPWLPQAQQTYADMAAWLATGSPA